MIDITIRVPDEKWVDVFWGWYLDGGGVDDFAYSLEAEDVCAELHNDYEIHTRTIRHWCGKKPKPATAEEKGGGR